MAVGGIVSRSMIHSDGSDAARCPNVRISVQEKMVFESSWKSRKSWSERNMVWQ